MSPWRTIKGRRVYIGGRKRQETYQRATVHLSVPRQIQRSQEHLHLEREITKSVLSQVLNSAPLISELKTGYQLADAVFNNLDLVTQTYDAYQKDGWTGVTDVLGTKVVENTLSDIQTELAWYAISKFIPSTVHEQGKKLLSNVMGKVTSAEVSFIKNFLIEEKKSSGSQTRGQTKYIARPHHYSTKQPKIPDDVRYV